MKTFAEVRQKIHPDVGLQVFSATTGLGLDELLEVFDRWYQPQLDLT